MFASFIVVRTNYGCVAPEGLGDGRQLGVLFKCRQNMSLLFNLNAN